MPPTAPAIDAHHHLWDPARARYAWLEEPALAPIRRSFTMRDLHPLLRATGTAATVVVEARSCLEETYELLALSDAEPALAGVVGWVDLTDAELPGELKALRRLPGGRRLVGVRHQVQAEPDPGWLCLPEVVRGLSAVAAAGLVFDAVVRPHQLPAVMKVARWLPELPVVVDHLGKPPIESGELRQWQELLTPLAALPNVSAKLSGLVTEAGWASWTTADLQPCVDVALRLFGSRRLMVGSDWPVCLLAGSYADVLTAMRECLSGQAPAVLDDVFGGTAATVYRLQMPRAAVPDPTVRSGQPAGGA